MPDPMTPERLAEIRERAAAAPDQRSIGYASARGAAQRRRSQADVAALLAEVERLRGIVAAVAELHAPIPCSHDGKDGMCCAFCCIDGYGDQTLYCTARHEASTSCHPCPTAALLGGSVGDE